MGGFLERRIQGDISNILIPLPWQKLVDQEFLFRLQIHTDVYDGEYSFRVVFPKGYPFESPKLFCDTPIYHPNVDPSGAVCLKVLREGWMPSYDLNSILVSLLCSFETLSYEDALNVEAAQLLEYNYGEFIKKVREVESRHNNQSKGL